MHAYEFLKVSGLVGRGIRHRKCIPRQMKLKKADQQEIRLVMRLLSMEVMASDTVTRSKFFRA